ncbi:2-acylglycerol O-acyltransferase 2-like [Haemaphysalis longicornis]
MNIYAKARNAYYPWPAKKRETNCRVVSRVIMQSFGVKWTPLRLPLRRRLETLVVLTYTIQFWFLGCVTLLFLVYIFLCTRYYPLSLAYAAWMYWDRKTCTRGGRWSNWIRSCTAWRYFRNYFPVQLVKTCDLPADRNYLFGYHPHGLMVMGGACVFASDATNFRQLFPGIRTHLLALQVLFYQPIQREVLLASGAGVASRESLDCILGSKTPGEAAVLSVGGDAEARLTRPGSYKLILTKRKGFIRAAMKHGAPLVPVFAFGENELFKKAELSDDSWLRRLIVWYQRLTGFTPPLFWGRGFFQYSFGLVPRRKRIVVVVGKPLEVPKVECPSEEEVNRVHQQYIDALIQLFNDHKDKYAATGSELVII